MATFPAMICPLVDAQAQSGFSLEYADLEAPLAKVLSKGLRMLLIRLRFQGFQYDRSKWQKGNAPMRIGAWRRAAR